MGSSITAQHRSGGGAVAIAKGNGDGFGWTDNASTPEEAKAAALEMRIDVREFGWPCGL